MAAPTCGSPNSLCLSASKTQTLGWQLKDLNCHDPEPRPTMDVLVGTNEVRDRLICWSPSEPARPSAVVPITRLTRHSVQDVCLVPFA